MIEWYWMLSSNKKYQKINVNQHTWAGTTNRGNHSKSFKSSIDLHLFRRLLRTLEARPVSPFQCWLYAEYVLPYLYPRCISLSELLVLATRGWLMPWEPSGEESKVWGFFGLISSNSINLYWGRFFSFFLPHESPFFAKCLVCER